MVKLLYCQKRNEENGIYYNILAVLYYTTTYGDNVNTCSGHWSHTFISGDYYTRIYIYILFGTYMRLLQFTGVNYRAINENQ